MSKLFSDETLAHYGIPGMKHGIRRWQYPDGRFNEAGKERYFGKSTTKEDELNKLNNKISKLESKKEKAEKNAVKFEKKYEKHEAIKRKRDSRIIKWHKIIPGMFLLEKFDKWRSDRNFVKMEKNKRKIEELEKIINKTKEIGNKRIEKMFGKKWDEDETLDSLITKSVVDVFSKIDPKVAEEYLEKVKENEKYITELEKNLRDIFS